MLEEKIYEVCWHGSYTPKNIEKKIKDKDKVNLVLYQVYGTHPIYGDNVLLYIGMTEQGIGKRLNQHDYWMDEERYSKSTIYVASIGEFKDWSNDNTYKSIIFNKPERETIQQIEALLIYAHKPAHNSMNKKSAKKSHSIRIFNTEKYGSLFPEISSLFYDIESN